MNEDEFAELQPGYLLKHVISGEQYIVHTRSGEGDADAVLAIPLTEISRQTCMHYEHVGLVFKKREPTCVYAAVWQDHNWVAVIECFQTEQDARRRCAVWLHTAQKSRSYDIEVTNEVFAGCVYYASYGSEGAYVCVKRVEVG